MGEDGDCLENSFNIEEKNLVWKKVESGKELLIDKNWKEKKRKDSKNSSFTVGREKKEKV